MALLELAENLAVQGFVFENFPQIDEKEELRNGLKGRCNKGLSYDLEGNLVVSTDKWNEGKEGALRASMANSFTTVSAITLKIPNDHITT